ncbi:MULTISPECIES: GxxExxY protein [Cecembia]|uniref:GxxExxY protein n=1 Tax=Cecembia lonarensis (strain CCUG 58316 / KCTC 22772 / LW9) TaxID=1225176 RepID=K1LX95_CECL9|nr:MULTISPECIES: GxxExxY protein [Cecembia]EKB48769.1 GxxExxY protein [Cecembia lonarensis LW9]
MKPTKSIIKDLTYKINGAAIEVHKNLGPGLLESVYHQCFAYELEHRGLHFQSELRIPIEYKALSIESKLRCDFFVENLITVELKALDDIPPIAEAKLISYMKLLKSPKGIMYNFNVINLYHEGQRTYVNDFFTYLDD